MSQITALMLCMGAVAIGFLAASICQAAATENDASDYWHQGKEYGYRMGVADERRAVELRAKPDAPFDWAVALADTFPADGGDAYDHRLGVVTDLAPGRYWLTDEGRAALEDAQRDEAKAKHPSTWTEAHADRGPWPA